MSTKPMRRKVSAPAPRECANCGRTCDPGNRRRDCICLGCLRWFCGECLAHHNRSCNAFIGTRKSDDGSTLS